MSKSAKEYLVVLMFIILIAVPIGLVIYKLPTKVKTIYFAPYILKTHSCYTHASGCEGELIDTIFGYNIASDDAKISLNGSVSSGINGFFELALPAKKNYKISVFTTIDNLFYSANTTFSTDSGAADCITNFKLLN